MTVQPHNKQHISLLDLPNDALLLIHSFIDKRVQAYYMFRWYNDGAQWYIPYETNWLNFRWNNPSWAYRRLKQIEPGLLLKRRWPELDFEYEYATKRTNKYSAVLLIGQ